MDRGGVKIGRPLEHTGRHAGDYIAHTRDFLRQNDAHGKPLTTSAANALQKMFNVNGNDVHIRADGQGKIATQLKDAHGDPVGHTQVYDVKQLQPEIAKNFEYQVKRYIVSEHMNIPVEDLNNLKEVNGVYHSKNRDGDHRVIDPDNTEREAIDKDISSLGIDNNKQHIPDSVGKGILEHAVDQETKNEADPVKKQDLEDKIKNGTVYSYEYDGKNDHYKFYIIQEGKDYVNGNGKTDGDVREVAIDRESLPSQVKKGLEYYETKQAMKEEYRLEDQDIHNMRISDGKIHVDAKDGETTYTFKDDPSLMKNIKDRLAAKGFSINTQQISDSVGSAALEHAISKEADQTKKDALKDGMVYDYTYDKKSKEHVYHIVKKEKENVNGNEEVKDGKMEKVTFTDEEHKKLLEDATLNAVRKYGELPDGTKITDDMKVDFALNDKTKFVVEDTDGGKHTLTGDSALSDGRKLKDAIDSELNVKPRVETDVLSEKTDVLVGTQGTDSQKEIVEKKLAKYESRTKHVLRLLKFFGGANDMALQASVSVEALADKMLQAQDNPNQQQPMGSVATGAVRSWAKKKIKHNITMMKEAIKIEGKKSGPGKGAVAGKAMEHLKEIEEAIKKKKTSPDFTEEDRQDLLGHIKSPLRKDSGYEADDESEDGDD